VYSPSPPPLPWRLDYDCCWCTYSSKSYKKKIFLLFVSFFLFCDSLRSTKLRIQWKWWQLNRNNEYEKSSGRRATNALNSSSLNSRIFVIFVEWVGSPHTKCMLNRVYLAAFNRNFKLSAFDFFSISYRTLILMYFWSGIGWNLKSKRWTIEQPTACAHDAIFNHHHRIVVVMCLEHFFFLSRWTLRNEKNHSLLISVCCFAMCCLEWTKSFFTFFKSSNPNPAMSTF
jgi:hypothetical protein